MKKYELRLAALCNQRLHQPSPGVDRGLGEGVVGEHLERALPEMQARRREAIDPDGWPHFRPLKELPELNMIEQENFLKDHVLLYFEKQQF